MSENKILFIINKFSGGGYRPEVEGRIIDECAKQNIECSIEFTQGRGHATELAKSAVQEKNFTTVFAVGGDGTVNEVAQGLVSSDVRMGILPKGSGNGLARHLGIPINFRKSLSLIGSDRAISIDTFLVNGNLSVNVSGVGFDGHVAGLFGKDGKRGLVGYTKLVLKEFLSYKEFQIEITLDGSALQKESFIVALANSSQFGNNARLAPHASVCDQLIDVCFIKKVPIVQAAAFGYKLFTGQINKSAFVEIIKAKNVSMNFAHPMPYHIDGEAYPPTKKFEIIIQPSSLKMLLHAHVTIAERLRKYPI